MHYSSSIIANYLVSQKKEIKYQKLSRLKRKGNPSNDNEKKEKKKRQYQSETLLNFSDIIVTKEFVPLLQKGLDFKVATEKIHVIDILCGIEESVKNFRTKA